jgi:hypothetical protein
MKLFNAIALIWKYFGMIYENKAMYILLIEELIGCWLVLLCSTPLSTMKNWRKKKRKNKYCYLPLYSYLNLRSFVFHNHNNFWI